MTRFFKSCALVLMTVLSAYAEQRVPTMWQNIHTNAIAAWRGTHDGRALTVNPATREIRLLVEATGLSAGSINEFLLVGPLSDRAYESFAVAIAKPAEIVAACEDIGLKRGTCVDSSICRFWPVGDRVRMTFAEVGTTNVFTISELVRDSNHVCALDTGFMYTGGAWRGNTLLTETNMPSSIVSFYNCDQTLFDVPVVLGQSSGYGSLVCGKTFSLGTLLEVVIQPLPSKRIERTIHVTPSTMTNALAEARQCVTPGTDVYLTVDFDDTLTVAQAQMLANVFMSLDGHGVKINGYAPDGLYPRAFQPKEAWRVREGRMPQPFEIHVAWQLGGVATASLVFIEEDWSVEGLEPALNPMTYPIADPAALPALIERVGGKDSKVTVLFAFAPADAPLGVVMPYVRALKERMNTIYIFTE